MIMSFSEKLKNLRQEMVKNKIHYYIVPLKDIYGFEYLQNDNKRLEWLTGFTGSFAYCVVGLKTAALFTDGRYTMQIKQEADVNLYEIFQYPIKSWFDWLNEIIFEGEIIGFDPYLMSIREHETFLSKGFKIHPIAQNLIDQIWTRQPEKKTFKPSSFDIIYAGEDTRSKLARVVEKIKEKNSQALFITESDTICWLLNIRGNDLLYTPLIFSFCYITLEGKVHLFVDEKKVTNEFKTLFDDFVNVHSLEEMGKVFTLYKGQQVIAFEQTLSIAMKNILAQAGLSILYSHDPADLFKLEKNPVEIQGMKNAHISDAVSFCLFWKWLETQDKDGLTEIFVQKKLDEIRLSHPDSIGLSFSTISGSGPNGAIIHYKVSEESSRSLKKDFLLLVDSGGQYKSGTTDITRTLCLKENLISDDVKKHYTLVLKGLISLGRAIFPEKTCGEQIDILARQYLWAEGLDYQHGTGHGVGCCLSVHEGRAAISKRQTGIALKEGMVFSNEPGYYKEGAYGIRLENLIYIKKNNHLSDKEQLFYCFEDLTLVPFDARLIDFSMLTLSDQSYLKEYHQKVLAQLKNEQRMTDDIYAFINQKCAPFLALGD